MVTEVAEDFPASIFKVVKEEWVFLKIEEGNSSEKMVSLHN
jgi:hypothetical protein